MIFKKGFFLNYQVILSKTADIFKGIFSELPGDSGKNMSFELEMFLKKVSLTSLSFAST